jgi:hypothetical protein
MSDDTARALRELAEQMRASMSNLEKTVGKLAVLVERQLTSDDNARKSARRLVEQAVGADEAARIRKVVAAKMAGRR